MRVYYSSVSRTLFIDEPSRRTELQLPAGLNPTEIAYVIASDTMRAVIEQLTKNGGD